MADYDLGTAHGQVVITYDGKGTKQATDDFQKVEKASESLDKKLKSAATGIVRYFRDIDNGVAKTARQFGILTGGIAILTGLSSATGRFGGALLSLRGGSSILGALGTTLGGLPKNVQGFPKIIKNIILLSSAITLVAGSTRLIGSIVGAFSKMNVIQPLLARAGLSVASFGRAITSKFPALGGIVTKLSGTIQYGLVRSISGVNNSEKIIKGFGSTLEGLGKPIATVAKLALTIGSLIKGVKITMQLAKGVGVLGAALAALGGAINIVAGLGAAITQLSGLVGLIPAAGYAAALGIGTLVVGLKGFGDAMKNIDDPAKFAESISKMAPAAQGAAIAIRDMYNSFKPIQLEVQDALFRGLGQTINTLSSNYLPILRTSMVSVATGFNAAAQEILAFFNHAELVGDVSEGFGFFTQIVNNLTSALPPLVEAFWLIARVGGEVLAEVTGGARGAAVAFREWIGEARSSGRLREWMEGGIQALRDLWNISKDVAVSLRLIFSGLSSGNAAGFLTMLREGAAAMRAFLESARGQAALTTLRDLLQNSLQRAILLVKTAWEQFSPAIVTLLPLITQLGAAFSGVLVVAMQILGPIVRGVAEALAFLAPVIVPLMTVLFAMGVASKVLSVSLGLLINGFMLVTNAIRAVTVVWKILQFLFLTNPWVALISFIILLVILIVTNWDTIKEYLATAWEWIKSTAITVWNAIVSFFTGIWAGIVAVWTTVWTAIKTFLIAYWTTMITVAMTIWNGIINFFTTLWTIVSTAWLAAWTVITTFLASVWQGIVTVAMTIWNGLVTFFTAAWEIIFNIFRFAAAILLAIFFTIFGPLINLAIMIWTQISTFLRENWSSIVAFFQMIWNTVVIVWQTIWTIISTVAMTIWNAIVAFLTMIWNSIVAQATALWNIMVMVWSTVWNAVSAVAMSIWNAIMAFLTGVWNTIVAVATAAWNAVSSVIMSVWNAIWGFIGPILNTISNAIATAWNKVVSVISGAMSAAWGVISSIWNQVVSFLTGVWARITGAVSNGVSSVMNLLSGLWSRITGLAGSAMNLLVQAGRNIVQGLWNGIKAMGSWLYNAIMGWIRSVVPGPILSFLGIASPSKWMRDKVGQHIPTGMVEGIKKTTGKATAGARDLAKQVAEASVITKRDMAGAGRALAAAAPTSVPLISTDTGKLIAGARASTAAASTTAPAPDANAGNHIEQLVLQVAGNLDPTNPLAWRQAMEGIRSGIRQVEKSKK